MRAAGRSGWTRWCVGLAGLAAVLGLVSGPGTRLTLWGFRAGLLLMLAGGVVGTVCVLVGAVGAVRVPPPVRRRDAWILFPSLVMGAVVAGVVGYWLVVGLMVPPIHDITTNPEDPPEFHDLRPQRLQAPNEVNYPGPNAARQQRRAYPGIETLHLEAPPETVYARARATLRSMGMRVVAADTRALHLEAVATTFWFGFSDDVAVRVRADTPGSRVDVRSASRVGRSDLGANARRIRTFLRRMRSPPPGTP